jgi:hypothetical protein
MTAPNDVKDLKPCEHVWGANVGICVKCKISIPNSGVVFGDMHNDCHKRIAELEKETNTLRKALKHLAKPESDAAKIIEQSRQLDKQGKVIEKLVAELNDCKCTGVKGIEALQSAAELKEDKK